MSGEQFANLIDRLLAERGISKGEFYKSVGISATAMYGWRKGAEPKRETVKAVENYFGTNLLGVAEIATTGIDSDTAALLQSIRERQDLRILLHSAKDVPASSIYALISQIEKMKEDEG